MEREEKKEVATRNKQMRNENNFACLFLFCFCLKDYVTIEISLFLIYNFIIIFSLEIKKKELKAHAYFLILESENFLEYTIAWPTFF